MTDNFVCSRCKEVKNFEAFNKDKHSPRGRRSECRDCASISQGAADRRWRSKNPEKMREVERNYSKRNKKKRRAKTKVKYALSVGKLERQSSCQVCGSSNSVCAHHDDYDKPLDVRWLCARCHSAWHRENGEGLNARDTEAI